MADAKPEEQVQAEALVEQIKKNLEAPGMGNPFTDAATIATWLRWATEHKAEINDVLDRFEEACKRAKGLAASMPQ